MKLVGRGSPTFDILGPATHHGVEDPAQALPEGIPLQLPEPLLAPPLAQQGEDARVVVDAVRHLLKLSRCLLEQREATGGSESRPHLGEELKQVLPLHRGREGGV